MAGIDALKNRESILKYAKTQMPCVYDDFVGEAKKCSPTNRKANCTSFWTSAFGGTAGITGQRNGSPL